MNNKNSKIYEYDAIRFIATILVVVGHSAYTTMQTKYGGLLIEIQYSSVQQILLLIVRLIYSFHMPLFIFLAGSLYEIGVKNGKWVSVKELVKAKALRLLVPFVLVTLFWLLPLKYFSGYYSLSESVIKDMFLGQIIFFDNCHLWYIVSLFWIFLITWIIDRSTQHNSIKLLLIIILFGTSLIMPNNFLGVKKAFCYLIYFFYGRIYERKRTGIYRSEKKLKIYLSVCVLIFSIGIYAVYFVKFKNNNIVYEVVGLGGINITLLFVLWLKKVSFRLDTFFPREIIRNSFEIYLFADPVNYVILSILILINGTNIYESGIGCLGMFVFRAFFSTCVALLVKKMIDILKKKLKEGIVF